MAEPLATTYQLAARLPFVMDDAEIREATGALEDLSDEARRLGSPSWDTPVAAPSQVVTLILRAAARHMKNYDGVIQSRAGDEAVVFHDPGADAGSASFTPGEARILRELTRGSSGFLTVQMGFDSPMRKDNGLSEWVPVRDGGDLFPYGREPW